MRLVDRSRVAVIGGGPAGALFSIFLLDLASAAGLRVGVDIYEPRDFQQPAPGGCSPLCSGGQGPVAIKTPPSSASTRT
ncbi:MAG: hypothetical protein HY303_08925 [Candidatus Wallbacteria bacterium]|nr:hypothetical protein [Candidatus Wallbacteria bacterium]